MNENDDVRKHKMAANRFPVRKTTTDRIVVSVFFPLEFLRIFYAIFHRMI